MHTPGFKHIRPCFSFALYLIVWGVLCLVTPVLADEAAPHPENQSAVTQPVEQESKPSMSEKRVIVHRHAEFSQAMQNSWLHGYFIPIFPVLFFVWIGASVGSFLNVVIYRLPAGLALSKPKSRCPKCLTPIQFRDNIPILGWLILRGKCRACGTSIPGRYPIIETIVAAIFGVLLFVEFGSGGANLPLNSLEKSEGIIWMFSKGHLDFLALYLWHAVLLTILLAMAMIHYDGHRIPWKLMTSTVAIWLVSTSIWVGLYPVPLNLPGVEFLTDYQWSISAREMASVPLFHKNLVINLLGPVTGLVGAFTGALVGSALVCLYDSQAKSNLVKMGITVGLFLGWQAVLSTAIIYVILIRGWILKPCCTNGPLNGLRWFISVVLQIILWKLIYDYGHTDGIIYLLVGLFICSSLLFAHKILGTPFGTEFTSSLEDHSSESLQADDDKIAVSTDK